MFDVPGFNTSSMTDDELMTKQLLLSQRLVVANRFGSGDMIMQLSNLIQSVEAERRDRMLHNIFKYQQKIFPEIIETEPDLVVVPVDTDEESHKKMIQRKRIVKERIVKSSMPTRNEG
jgi:hypothetical protein